jgi:hypothetical protein
LLAGTDTLVLLRGVWVEIDADPEKADRKGRKRREPKSTLELTADGFMKWWKH